MNAYAVGPVIVLVTLIVALSGTLLLRPISKSLSAYLQMLMEQKKAAIPNADARKIGDILASLDERLSRIEERQRFTDALYGERSGSSPRVATADTDPHGRPRLEAGERA